MFLLVAVCVGALRAGVLALRMRLDVAAGSLTLFENHVEMNKQLRLNEQLRLNKQLSLTRHVLVEVFQSQLFLISTVIP